MTGFVDKLIESINTPWKAWLEIRMLLLTPIAKANLAVNGIEIGKNFKFYGLPKILKHKDSYISIGNNFENRNWFDSNPLGINHPTIINSWKNGATIKIGNDVGISGGCICAASRVEIGDGTLVGANATIIDTDFHPIKSKNRRYETDNVKTRPVRIGKNVFIGTGAIILKGAVIPDNSVIPAGSVVTSKTM